MGDPLLPVSPPPRALVSDYPSWVEPLDALETLRGRRHPALLLSALEGHPSSRFSILACDPPLVVALRGGEATLAWAESGRREDRRVVRDPFDLLRALAPAAAVESVEGLPFAGGAIGYLGYGLRRSVESLPGDRSAPLGHPDAWFGLYDSAVVFDHTERRVVILSVGLGSGDDGRRRARARERLGDLRRCLERASLPTEGRRTPVASPRQSALFATPREEHLRRVARALDYIAAGDLYQVNLSHRIECPFEGDPIALFQELSRRNPAPFAAYLDAGPFQIVCASPERFVSLRDGAALSSPIKGTRPRGADAASDERLARDLARSAKDRAENVMITDLVRNDLGRVCEPGSVRVEKLCALESFTTVHHLVSTVGGRLRPDRDRADLLRALFPGGSMTGAPKVRAMQVLDELEEEERGVYSGGIGYLSFDGGLDFNIVIRTILCASGRAHLRVGGGIVADSDPEEEYRETLDKARALLEVLGAG
ncbi:MAG TPA: aminodeoxychorismate synthase component I [Candidatus Polarisedimenticolia bacterium]|nr:aminodeoxychorismate synthase component I [Candidatus Polarisedimenticolia bacterium]